MSGASESLRANFTTHEPCDCLSCRRNRAFLGALHSGDIDTAQKAYDSLFEECAELDQKGAYRAEEADRLRGVLDRLTAAANYYHDHPHPGEDLWSPEDYRAHHALAQALEEARRV